MDRVGFSFEPRQNPLKLIVKMFFFFIFLDIEEID